MPTPLAVSFAPEADAFLPGRPGPRQALGTEAALAEFATNDRAARAFHDASLFDELIAGLEVAIGGDRRQAHRYLLEGPLTLTPLGELSARGMPQGRGAPITVAGRDIARSGIGFTYAGLLKCRAALIHWQHPRLGPVEIEVEIAWRRYASRGIYDYGCRIKRSRPKVGGL